MKKRIIVLMMAIMITGLITGNAVASDWEAVGGMSIIDVTLDQWNTQIDNINKVLNEGTSVPGSPKPTNTDEMDNIDRVPMLFLGAKRKINDKWSSEFRYEYIFGEVEGEADFGPAGYHEAAIEVDLHGLAALAEYSFNDNWSARGGIGIYNGTKNKSFEGVVFKNINEKTEKVTPEDKDFDLDAVSYRLGVGYTKAFAENWDFDANLDYLYMEIDDEDDGNVYSKGFSYTAGLTYHF